MQIYLLDKVFRFKTKVGLMKTTVLAFIFPFLLMSPLLAAHESIVEKDDSFTADYVIIGSGPAGAPIAELLSRDKKRSVIVLEAGSNHNDKPVIKFSKYIPKIVGTYASQFSWEQSTIVQPNLKRSFNWITGRLLGGASAVNGTFWLRGSDQVFSKWQKFGGKKWSVDRIHKIFKYLEHYDGKSANPQFRGHHGQVHVRFPKQTTPTGVKFANAIFLATGSPIIEDYNEPKTTIGTSEHVQWTQRGPKGLLRVSSATAFLNKKVVTEDGKGVHGRKLRVLTDTTALKTIWDGKKAIGVETLRKGKYTKIFARKKVIVCAGINSSQFLMLSGIGPKELLESKGIPVKFDNPHVGVGVQDNPAVVTLWSANPNDPVNPPGDPANIAPFYCFLPSPSGKNPKKRVVQITARSFIPGSLALGVVLCNQKSKGAITLHSKDPLEMPRVDLGIFSREEDIEEFKQIFKKYILAIAEQMTLIDPTYQLLVPSADVINNDAQLTAFLKAAVDVPTTIHNYTSHCRLGPVVTGDGEVRGVKNLIVADSSIAPTTTDGACMAMSYMIGTNIALQILEKEGKEIKLPDLHK
jgi:choline dehydrogenase